MTILTAGNNKMFFFIVERVQSNLCSVCMCLPPPSRSNLGAGDSVDAEFVLQIQRTSVSISTPSCRDEAHLPHTIRTACIVINDGSGSSREEGASLNIFVFFLKKKEEGVSLHSRW